MYFSVRFSVHGVCVTSQPGLMYNRSQDYLLPRSLTLRLAKSVLPPNTTVQKDAVLAMQKAATVFVSYLSSQYVYRHNCPIPGLSTSMIPSPVARTASTLVRRRDASHFV